MISAVMAVVVAAGTPNLERARRLYDRARYDEALRALGPSCRNAEEVAACERWRAYIQVALGQPDEALAAFQRLFAVRAEASLGNDVSPKIKTLFETAERQVKEVRELVLQPIAVSEDEPWRLVVQAPKEGAVIRSLEVNLQPPGHDSFQQVELHAEGDSFIGTLVVGETGQGGGRYFLKSVLASDAELFSGADSAPRQIEVQSGGEPPAAVVPPTPSPFDSPALGLPAPTASGDGLPNWAVWAIAGGGVAVVATAVALVVVLGRDDKPGTIRVNIAFEDDP